jgi:MFS family permease
MRVYIYIRKGSTPAPGLAWGVIVATLSISAPVAAAHPLRNRHFRLLWIGRTISNLGDQFYLVALPWLVLSLSNSGVALGTIMMTATIPMAALMLVGGAVSDRVSPRRVWISSTLLRALAVAGAGILVLTHVIALWHVYVLAFIFGVADAFAAPAAQALMPSLVEREQLPAANSITQVTQQLTTIVGPAPAGLIIRAVGLAWAFFIDAVSFVFMLVAIWRLPDPPQSAAAPRRGLLHSIGEGLHYINSDPALRSLFLVLAALNFCLAGPVSIGLAWITKQHFGSPVAFSILVSSVAAGSLLGAVLAGFIKSQQRGQLILAVSTLIAFCSAFLGLLLQLWSLAVVLLVMGACAGFLNIHILSWFQERVAREMLGRAMSVLMFAAIGLAPISLLLAGVAVKWSVTGMFFSSAALMMFVTALAALTRSVRDIR